MVSHEIMRKVLPLPIRGPNKCVLIVLADHADKDAICWPSVGRLTLECGLCERTIRNALAELREQGFIAVRYTTGKNNTFVLTLPEPKDPGTSCRGVNMTGVQDMHHPPAPDAPPPGTSCTTPLHVVPPNHHRTVIEPSGNRQSTSPEPDGFAQFWNEYPRKVAKPMALRAYAKAITKTTPETLIASVRKHRDSQQWKRDNGQFIPHPATWLNQERWNDTPASGPVQTCFHQTTGVRAF